MIIKAICRPIFKPSTTPSLHKLSLPYMFFTSSVNTRLQMNFARSIAILHSGLSFWMRIIIGFSIHPQLNKPILG
jgi:hypothetical protein